MNLMQKARLKELLVEHLRRHLHLRHHLRVIRTSATQIGELLCSHLRYIGETFTHAVKLYELRTGESLQWVLTPSTGEIRSIIVSWPVHTMSSFKGPMEHLELSIKPIDRWSQLSAADFGMKERDSDSHTPYLYLLRKAAAAGRRADRHFRSEAGKQKDAEKRKQKQREKRAKR